MVGRRELWKMLEASVGSAELCLYDVDMPAGDNGTLRVYVAKRDSHGSGVSVDDCAAVSRRLAANPDFDTLLHQCGLEVSSPGVNRRLRLDEHYAGAVGERVKVSSRAASGKMETIVGKLLAFKDNEIEIAVIGGKDSQEVNKVSVPVKAIQKARIDFEF